MNAAKWPQQKQATAYVSDTALNRRADTKRLLNFKIDGSLLVAIKTGKAARGCPTRRIATLVYHRSRKKYTTFFVHNLTHPPEAIFFRKNGCVSALYLI
jgi:hypothetical protein